MPMWKGKAHSCSSCLYKTMGMVSQKKTSVYDQRQFRCHAAKIYSPDALHYENAGNGLEGKDF